jgi:hypothetical protein
MWNNAVVALFKAVVFNLGYANTSKGVHKIYKKKPTINTLLNN